MSYQPKPIDTSGVSLPDGIMALSEALAKNIHEVWAQGRLRDGWRYGPHYDGDNKIHPCLVPYEELPESERDYDRSTSLETLKFIVLQGYDIVLKEK
ncbi:MAG: RyR domain-containing protein [Clostridia bacterium]|nr:RyR domain-containing protein [Clostridia bacterium]